MTISVILLGWLSTIHCSQYIKVKENPKETSTVFVHNSMLLGGLTNKKSEKVLKQQQCWTILKKLKVLNSTEKTKH